MAASTRRPITSQLPLIKARGSIAFWLFAGLYLGLIGRVIFLQVARHAYFLHEAYVYRVSRDILPATRGLILDRDGRPLAVNVPASAIYADPVAVKDPVRVAAQLAPIIGMDPAKLAAKITPRSPRDHYVSLVRHAPLSLGAAVRAANLPGVGVEHDTRRAYPNGGLAAQVLGFTNNDGKGIEGLEDSQDSLLQGRDGLVVGEIDREDRFLPGTIRTWQEPKNGSDVVLTLDGRLQQVAESELAKTVSAHHARNGVVVVMDPQTGEILALANAPAYDPNHPRPVGPVDAKDALALASRWRDCAVSDLYEPGSTLKSITASAVLQEQGMDMMNVHVFCSGTLQVGGHTIHCAPDPPDYGVHGDETLRDVLKNSCNIGMAQFGMRLGADKLYDFERKFGFLDLPDSGLPGETKSWLLSPDKFNRFTGSVGWSKIELANVSFGQGVSVTPLQLANAYCAIANGGTLMQPHIVRAVRTPGGDIPVAPKVIRQVLSANVASTMRSILGTVVQDGTGKPAQIGGFSVGGKTGSAQMAGAHGYEEGHFVASFVGLVPLSHPRFVILCAVFEPQGVHWGAAVAAPVVHNIAKAAVLEYHLIPDAPQQVDWDDHLKTKPEDRQHIREIQE